MVDRFDMEARTRCGVTCDELIEREDGDWCRWADVQEQFAEAERLILQLPCRCLNLGDGEYVECDRCRFLHGTAEQESDSHG